MNEGAVDGFLSDLFRQFGGVMDIKLLNIGFGNTVVANRIIAIVSPASAPMKRLKEDAKKNNRLIDATMGRKTRAIIITDSNHVILCGVQAETIAQRLIAEHDIKEFNLLSAGGTGSKKSQDTDIDEE